MEASEVAIRKCKREGCGLRFPSISGNQEYVRCPRCRAETLVIQSRALDREPEGNGLPDSGIQIEAFLDNVRSAWNVGAMFRTADGMGIRKMHLAGITATPENRRVAKTALGAEVSLPWTYYPDGVMAAQALQQEGYQLWALEQDARSEPVFQIRREDLNTPMIFVVGNEISGVDPGILACCERVVFLPMFGVKRSLNAAVAFGIAAYALLNPPDR